MHQGLEDEKGMAPARDKAPGHTTDSTVGRGESWSPTVATFRSGRCVRRVCGSWLPGTMMTGATSDIQRDRVPRGYIQTV